eukprot:177188_1
MQRIMDINQAPLDSVHKICSFLELSDIHALSQTSKHLYSVGDIVISTLEVVGWPKDEIFQKLLESVMSSGKMRKLRRVSRIPLNLLEDLGSRYLTSCPRFETVGIRWAKDLLRQMSDSTYIHKKYVTLFEPSAISDAQLILDCIQKLPDLESLCLFVRLETFDQILPHIIDKLSKTLTRFWYSKSKLSISTSLSIHSIRSLRHTKLQIIRIGYLGTSSGVVEQMVTNLPASLKLFILDVNDVWLGNLFDSLLPVLDKSYAIKLLDEGTMKYSTFIHELTVPEKLTVHLAIKGLAFDSRVLQSVLKICSERPLNNVKSLNLEEPHDCQEYELQAWAFLPPIHECFPNLERLIHCGTHVNHHCYLANLKELSIHAAYTHRLNGAFSVCTLTLSHIAILPGTVVSLLNNCHWPNLTGISFELEHVDTESLEALSEAVLKHLDLKNVEVRNLNSVCGPMLVLSDRYLVALGVRRFDRELYNIR